MGPFLPVFSKYGSCHCLSVKAAEKKKRTAEWHFFSFLFFLFWQWYCHSVIAVLWKERSFCRKKNARQLQIIAVKNGQFCIARSTPASVFVSHYFARNICHSVFNLCRVSNTKPKPQKKHFSPALPICFPGRKLVKSTKLFLCRTSMISNCLVCHSGVGRVCVALYKMCRIHTYACINTLGAFFYIGQIQK